jgi:hypothetical protein
MIDLLQRCQHDSSYYQSNTCMLAVAAAAKQNLQQ